MKSIQRLIFATSIAMMSLGTPTGLLSLEHAAANGASERGLFAAGYQLPLRGNDLDMGERYGVKVHSDDNPDQVNALDIGGRRYISPDKWSGLTTDKASDKLNASYVIYKKPFYAMAGGRVISCWTNAPENVPPNNHKDKARIPNAGNHVWIRQDDGVAALYAHAVPGSISSDICPNQKVLMDDTSTVGNDPELRTEARVFRGKRVEAGDKLGLVGNSGDSSGPHLHVHMLKDAKPFVMKFARGLTTAFPASETAMITGPWKALNGGSMPNNVLFWPAHAPGDYSFTSSGANFQSLVDHLYDSGEMPELATCESNGASYTSKWVPGKGLTWMHHGMSPSEAAAKHAQYTSQGYKRISSYTCGSVTVAIWHKT